MNLRLDKIELTGNPNRPLRITFRLRGEQHTLDVAANVVDSFKRFRQVLLSEFGILARHQGEYPGQYGRTAWLNAVDIATQRGQPKAQEVCRWRCPT